MNPKDKKIHDYAFSETRALAQRLKAPKMLPTKEEYGTPHVLRKRRVMIKFAQTHKIPLGTWFDEQTPQRVRKILEDARKNSETLRLFYGDRISGKDWLQLHHVIGKIDRNKGMMSLPVIISDDKTRIPIEDAAIIRIVRLDDNQELYRHGGYHQPEIELTRDDDVHWGHPIQVLVDGQPKAQFKDIGKAALWVAFLCGDCPQLPDGITAEAVLAS